MDCRRRAIVVGADVPTAHDPHYPRRSAAQLRAALVEGPHGAYDPPDVTLLCGDSARAPAVLDAVRRAVAAGGERDPLLVYLSGAVRGVSGSATGGKDEIHLLTVDGALSLGRLVRDVLDEVRLPWAVLLDGFDLAGPREPYQGSRGGLAALAPHTARTPPDRVTLAALARVCSPRPGRRAVVIASVTSFPPSAAGVAHPGERPDPWPWSLTPELLRGLRGGAAGADGDVTLRRLARYLGHREDLRLLEERDRYEGTARAGRPAPRRMLWVSNHESHLPAITLTRPGTAPSTEASPSLRQTPGDGWRGVPRTATRDAGTLPSHRVPDTQDGIPFDAPSLRLLSAKDLTHPLDASAPLIRRVLDALFAGAGDDLGRPGPQGLRDRLDHLRSALRSPLAGLVECGSGRAVAGSWTDPTAGAGLTGLVEELVCGRRSVGRHAPGRLGRAADGTPVLAVPLAQTREDVTLALVVVLPDPAMLGIGEPLAAILREFVTPDPALRDDALEMEIGVLTGLRERFGMLPTQLYERALERYRRKLASLVVIFEPVVALHTDAARLGVHSWEALARRREGDRSAPVRLLDVASVWGERFIVERDVLLAAKALHGYREAHAAGPWRDEAPRPLAINVAVRSIMSDDYVGALREVIRDAGLAAGGLTLEISEKDSITPPPREIWLPTPMEYFRQRISSLSKDLTMNFAVDDFGVGNASLDRLASLTLTQIKIDRAILGHPLAREELELVVRVAEQAFRDGDAARARPIVMEGVEPDAGLSLAEIYATGIRYVQGYILGEVASSRLRPLESGLRERIAALVGAAG